VPPDRDRPDHHAQGRRGEGAGENRELRGEAPHLGGVRADVAEATDALNRHQIDRLAKATLQLLKEMGELG
jgi:hypothetical protein